MVSPPNGSEPLQCSLYLQCMCIVVSYACEDCICNHLLARQFAELKCHQATFHSAIAHNKRLQMQSNTRKPNQTNASIQDQKNCKQRCFLEALQKRSQLNAAVNLSRQRAWSSRTAICQGTWMPLLHAGWPAEPGSHWQIADPANSFRVEKFRKASRSRILVTHSEQPTSQQSTKQRPSANTKTAHTK